MCCSYNSHKSLIEEHLKELIKAMYVQFYCKTCDSFMLIVDCNGQADKTNLAFFCEIYVLKKFDYRTPLL